MFRRSRPCQGLPASRLGPGRALWSRRRRLRPSSSKLHDTYGAAVADPVVRQKVIDAGAELLQSSPQEMADYMRKEVAKWAEVIRAANIQLE